MIDPERIIDVFKDCLFNEGEDTTNHIEAEGIQCRVGFHPERLKSHAAEIHSWLDQLPKDFHEDGGGGMSFLQACQDRDGNQWTGLHERMEQLFQLGIAIGRVQCCMPRELWDVLPGGMPYYTVRKRES